jgi:hypothetical protein
MRLTKAPILVPPNWTKEFQVYVDASNFTIGIFLSQKNEKSFDHPIYFANRQYKNQPHYYQKKSLGMIYYVQKN